MKTYDFEYDGRRLSGFGFTVCNFDSEDIQTVSNGSQLTFNTVSAFNGQKFDLVSSEYTDYLTTTFQICKDPCEYEDMKISLRLMRKIMTWLNRKSFHKIRILNPDYIGCYFEGSFNVSKIELGDDIVGFELEMITNRPFALGDDVVIEINNKEAGGTANISSESDEEGFLYPKAEITLAADGNLTITNAFDGRTMEILNCTSGETITLDYPVIQSSVPAHQIQNDFNWEFLRICRIYESVLNTYTISLPCKIKLTYAPIVKIGL